MNKKSKAVVVLAAVLCCLVLLLTTHAFTGNQKKDNTASDEVKLTKILDLDTDLEEAENSEENEGELTLFSLESTGGALTAGIFVGGQNGDFIGLPAEEAAVRSASITPVSLGLVFVSVTAEVMDFSEPAPFLYDKAIAKVNEFVNIRAEASANSEIVGKLYKNSYGTILERGEEWTKLTSGSVTGYIKNDYLYFDATALDYAREAGDLTVEITAGSVNLRKEPNTDCEVLKKAAKGTVFIAYPELSTDEFYAIGYENETAYVTRQYSEIKLSMKKAVSKEEEAEAKHQAEVKKALIEAKKVKVGKTTRDAVKVSDEEIYLLATVVSSEALYESYEGKLAVANVVVNRLVSGKWGDSISDVVYAAGQFSGAKTGRFEKYAKLMDEDCKKAAVEALAGVNNIGDFMFFRTKGSAKLASYSKYYILGNHCFYAK